MKAQFAVVRHEISHLLIPQMKGDSLNLKDKVLRSYSHDNDEFNTKIQFGIKTHYVNSIDLEFFNTRKEANNYRLNGK